MRRDRRSTSQCMWAQLLYTCTIVYYYIHFVRIIESRTFSTAEEDGRNPAGPRGLYLRCESEVRVALRRTRRRLAGLTRDRLSPAAREWFTPHQQHSFVLYISTPMFAALRTTTATGTPPCLLVSLSVCLCACASLSLNPLGWLQPAAGPWHSRRGGVVCSRAGWRRCTARRGGGARRRIKWPSWGSSCRPTRTRSGAT